MAFFTRSYCAPQPSFVPLLRLFDDLENQSQQSSQQRSRHSHVQSFQPKFDIREVEDAYELYGELAGLNKEDIQIEFTDPQTLRIHGRVERSYKAGASSSDASQESQSEDTINGSDEAAEKLSHGHRQPTVEDDFENVTAEEASLNSPATVDATDATTTQEAPKEERARANNDKYWVAERKIGEFDRTFRFSGFIEQDFVTANLQDGLLIVRVPKTPEDSSRHRVQIN